MRSLSRWTARTRQWPPALRWSAAVAMVCLAEWLHQVVFDDTNLYPYVFAFPVVVLAGIMFERNAGSVALLTSIAFASFTLPPGGNFAVQNERDAFELILYAALATITLVMLEALRNLHTRAANAQEAATTAEVQAAATEREHNILLAEFRHRVKNDLARLAATFALRAAHASPETADALQAASSRVHLFATIYDQMALRKGTMVTDMHDFLRDLVRDLNATIEREQPVGLILDAEAHILPFGQASAIALIVNELVTNALKHAFPDDRAGMIRVEFRRENDEYVLVVADDGIGMTPVSVEPKGQGSRIVRALAAQLGGRLQTGGNPAGGTAHVLRFPVSPEH
jgi:two-component system, sensor histidine kinase PdtaS